MDESQPPPANAATDASEPFPTAEVRPSLPAQLPHLVRTSRLWWVTALCVILAILLGWWQTRSVGSNIRIEFAEGHGLVPDDTVRYRGIQVGRVRRIELTEECDAVEVDVELAPAAAELAREGTQFWIERPEIRVGQVRGLETIVGGRYIGLVPGPVTASPADRFVGLEAVPESLHPQNDGLEIVLESTARFGLQPGSPVTHRGVEVGHVLSTGLAGDSATVQSHVYIGPAFRALIRENSQFWRTSGLDVRFGLSGFELAAESLATIAAGGVALATPDRPGHAVVTGHRFTLHEAAAADWLDWQPRIALGGAALPADLSLPKPDRATLRLRQPGLSFFSRSAARGWVLPVAGDRLLGPATLLAPEDPEEFVLEFLGQELSLGSQGVTQMGSVVLLDLPGGLELPDDPWPMERVRRAQHPEDVVVTCGSETRTLPLPADRMRATDTGWLVDASVPLDESWDGASVVAVSDGHLIGLLIWHEGRSMIMPFSDAFSVLGGDE